jgi:predicted PurR-regulated permease PerM
MGEIYNKYKLFFLVLIVVAVGFFAWYFMEIIVFILVAGVVSIIGYPLVELFDKIRIRKFRFPHSLSAILTLLLILAFVISLLGFFIPLVLREASMISSIDGSKLTQYYTDEIHWLEVHMTQFGILKPGVTIETLLKSNISKIIDFNIFTNIISGVLSFTGTFFFNLFSILFLSYFFLYDNRMLPKFILLLVPDKYEEKTKSVMSKSKTLLSRYFIGLILNVLVMIVSYAIALTIVGAKGAIVIAFFGGIVNIIPYIGPIFGILTGIVLGVTGVISAGMYGEMWPMAFKIFLAMEIVILLDNFLYGPYIQGKSVKAHPVEIFLVIIAAGSIGGIPMMIIAVPTYAVLRIVAGEFLSQFRFFRKLSSGGNSPP